MNKSILILSMLVWLGCESKRDQPDAPAIAPSNYSDITFNSKIIDGGTVNEGDTLVGEFIFSNSSLSTLVIDYVNPDCICTTYSLSKKELKPGESGSIKLVLDTKGKSGPQKIYAVVKANTKSKFHRLILKADIN